MGRPQEYKQSPVQSQTHSMSSEQILKHSISPVKQRIINYNHYLFNGHMAHHTTIVAAEEEEVGQPVVIIGFIERNTDE